MGMTIAGYVDIGRPMIANSFSLGNVVAFFRANIHKSFFNDWVNLTQLQERFPTRVDLTGSMVSFQGPVAIIASPITFKVAFVGLISLIGVGSYFGAQQLFRFLENRNIMVVSDTTSKVISAVAASCITVAVGALFYTSGAFALSAGIYFL